MKAIYRCRLIRAVTLWLLFVPGAFGTTFTWTGNGSDDLWSSPFNWSPFGVPGTGDDLVFNIAGSSENNLSSSPRFNTITITNHQITGNAISLEGGVTASNARIDLEAITLTANQSFAVPGANREVVINSAIDLNGRRLVLSGAGNFVLAGFISGGSGGITWTSTGTGKLERANTYLGITRIDAGELQIFGSQPASPVHNMGGILGGSGVVGAVQALTAPATIAPNGVNATTAILTVNGNFEMSPNQASLAIDLKGTTAGSGHDQIKVTNGGISLTFGNNLVVSIAPGFTPAPGNSFVIINNDGTDAIGGNFLGLREGGFFTVGTTAFFITYKGGDGNDAVLTVPARWDGGGTDNFWTTPANWVGNVAPLPGQPLFFPANSPRSSNTNNFPNGTFFPGIFFTGGYAINGNAITLGAGGLVAGVSTVVSVSNDITLTAPSTFQADAGGALDTGGDVGLGPHRLTVNALSNSRVSFGGAVTGTGEIHKFGGEVGRLDLFGDNTTNVAALKIFEGDLFAGSNISTPIFLDAGRVAPAGEIQMTGNGPIGPLTVGSAMVSAGGFSGPGRLTINGDLLFRGSFPGPGIILVDLAGATGNNHDKIIVNGAVTLTPPDVPEGDITADVSVNFQQGFAPSVGSTFVIISNDGTDQVIGAFVGKPEGSTFIVGGTTFRVSYKGGDGNDVVLSVVAAAPTPAPSPSLANISTRLRVLTGENVLIGGMIATGTQSKRVIIRAIGPTLTDLGLPGALPDPSLELFQGNQLLASNDDWRLSAQQADIEHSGFAPGKDQEAAIIVSLTPNQNFTAIVRGKAAQTGIALVEAFDLDELAPVKLANISTRGFVDVGDRVMIAGLIVSPSGAANLKVLVRALGPTLGDFGVQGFLANPTLELRDSNGGLLRQSNDWKNDGQRAEIEAAQLAPGRDLEAALIESLPPGAFTAIVRGAGGTTGVGLVEVYKIQ